MRRLLLAALLILAVAAAVAVALLLTGGGHQQATTSSKTTQTTTGPQAFQPDPKAASWDKPFRTGNPQATKYGEAFQILDPAHPPAHATDVYWLGPTYHGLYPYARAMLGGGAEVMRSTVVYGDKLTVELSRLTISAYSTAPLSTVDTDTGSRQSEGGKLLAELKQASGQTTNGFHWAAVTTSALQPGTQAIVELNPHLVVQIIRLDSRVPPLATLVAALRPYPR